MKYHTAIKCNNLQLHPENTEKYWKHDSKTKKPERCTYLEWLQWYKVQKQENEFMTLWLPLEEGNTQSLLRGLLGVLVYTLVSSLLKCLKLYLWYLYLYTHYTSIRFLLFFL